MVSKNVVINNKLGLHARPACAFAKEAGKYKSSVNVRVLEKDHTFNAKSLMNVLAAGIKYGTELEVICNGDDEVNALDGMITAIEKGLGE